MPDINRRKGALLNKKDVNQHIGMSEMLLKMYEQDCESYRYQDQLRWSRLKVAIAIEAALLSVALTNAIISTTNNLYRCCIIFVLFILVHILFTLARKDNKDAGGHIKRIQYFEKDIAEKYEGLKFQTEPVRLFPFLSKCKGEKLMQAIILIISLINIILILAYLFNFLIPGWVSPVKKQVWWAH